MITIASVKVSARALTALALFVLLGSGILAGLLGGRRDLEVAAGVAQASRAAAQIAAVEMLRQRFSALLDGDLTKVRQNYDLDSYGGQAAWDRESGRVQYLRKWLAARGVVLTEAAAWFEVDHVSAWGAVEFRLEVTEHATYAYQKGETLPSHRFGSRTVHVLVVRLEGNRWQIERDWYADPLGDCPGEPGVGPVETPISEPSQAGRYDRSKALAYAVRHSGVRSLPGGGYYNRSYVVYSYQGGDCANFASQVLAAGGVPQGYGWFSNGEGSVSWLCSSDLTWHLLNSGRGTRLSAGAFEEVAKPTAADPYGAVSRLEPGDIIAYQVKGSISHVAVVAGRDPYGCPVVASHTSDRLFFPWDLGWGKDTVFWLIHVTY